MTDATVQDKKIPALDPNRDSHETMTRLFYLEPERFSRNKHFEAFKLPRVRFAKRVAKLLASLRRDLLGSGVRVIVDENADGGLFIEQRRAGRTVRRTLLTPAEFQLLWTDPRLAERYPEISSWDLME